MSGRNLHEKRKEFIGRNSESETRDLERQTEYLRRDFDWLRGLRGPQFNDVVLDGKKIFDILNFKLGSKQHWNFWGVVGLEEKSFHFFFGKD